MAEGFYFIEVKRIVKKYSVKLLSLAFNEEMKVDILLSNEPNSIEKKESMLKEIRKLVPVNEIKYADTN